jgi:signal transduction histidine kinase
VLDNLIVNAIKHTPKNGSVRITSAFIKGGDLTLHVTDSGEGIPPAALATLFQKYSRVEGKKYGRSHDSGLGLLFCRMAIDLLGGEITVTSEVGQGSTFTLTLPSPQTTASQT